MKMDWLRTSLIASIAIVCFLLMIRWTEFREQQALKPMPQSVTEQNLDNPSTTETLTESVPSSGDVSITETSDIPSADPTTLPLPAVKAADANTIHINTDKLDVVIDLAGGDIVEVGLPTYFAKINTPDKPFELLKNSDGMTYIALSGLIGKNATDKPGGSRPIFSAEKKDYLLKDGDETLNVDLTYRQNDAVTITKRFSFKRGSHLIDMSYIVTNNSNEPWQANVYGQIKRNTFNPVVSAGLGMQPYLGAARNTDETNYDKIDFDDLDEQEYKHSKKGGWVAMVQHYFISAWVPDANDTNKYTLFKSKNSDFYYLQFVSPALSVAPNSSGEKHFGFYVGPKDIKTLETISPFLDLTVDYSFLWWIAKPLFYALDFIHDFVGNWGVAIIILTICIKALFFYPSAASYRSMAKMRKVQPKMAELKERYADNKQKFSSEMMKLYKEEKVNPLGGCLPILIQMPVFMALYWVLMESVELRQAPFALWITDLSVKDPYFVLPIVMGATMFIQQKLNPTPPDPMQAKVMQMMPIFFTFLFLVFPAGLVLYWVVNNTLSIIQQYFITKKIENS